MSVSDDSGATLALPAKEAKGSRSEAALLITEARESCRTENAQPIRNYTGERLFKERPRLYRLIVSMLAEGVLSQKAIERATRVDHRTIASIERREAESIPATKRKLTTGFGQLARMTLERLQEAVPDMNHAQLAVTAGIATDKFTGLVGDPNLRIEHSIKPGQGNIFDRMADLKEQIIKTVQARVIEPEPLQIEQV
jgi:hypothetical protein